MAVQDPVTRINGSQQCLNDNLHPHPRTISNLGAAHQPTASPRIETVRTTDDRVQNMVLIACPGTRKGRPSIGAMLGPVLAKVTAVTANALQHHQPVECQETISTGTDRSTNQQRSI